jgi:hypothetical protein
MYLGRCFTSSKIRPKYSPIMAMESSWMLEKNKIKIITVVKPWGAL